MRQWYRCARRRRGPRNPWVRRPTDLGELGRHRALLERGRPPCGQVRMHALRAEAIPRRAGGAPSHREVGEDSHGAGGSPSSRATMIESWSAFASRTTFGRVLPVSDFRRSETRRSGAPAYASDRYVGRWLRTLRSPLVIEHRRTQLLRARQIQTERVTTARRPAIDQRRWFVVSARRVAKKCQTSRRITASTTRSASSAPSEAPFSKSPSPPSSFVSCARQRTLAPLASAYA